MREPDADASDIELARYYDEHRDQGQWGESQPLTGARLTVTLSVRFTEDEITAVRERAAKVGLKVTTYIRRAALGGSEPVLDRRQLARVVEALSRDVEELRRTAS